MTGKTYNLRIGILFIIFCSMYGVIAINLFYIQIMRSDFFSSLGRQQYETSVTLQQPRAAILDRTGKQYFALNKESVAAFILPRSLQEPKKVAHFLQRHFPAAYERLQNHDESYFMYIRRRLNPEQIELIHHSGLADIKLLNEPSRYYPNASAGAVIGITDIDNKGLFGLEMYCNKKLAGQPMVASLEKDARSGHFYFDKKTMDAGLLAKPLRITISSDLQFLVNEELQQAIVKFKASEGALLIIDPRTGDILAMTSQPGFDPNQTGDLDLESAKNRVISNAYELGSVFKVFAAMAALQEGVVQPDELIDCQGVETGIVEGRKVNTVKSSIRGVVPFYEVIAVSNNIGIATVAQRVGTKMYDYYRRLGFGSKTGISLPGEHAGMVNHPRQWSRHSIISLSYGYEVTATLLQLARAFCIIANYGYGVKPRILMDEPIEKTHEPLFSTEVISTIRSILENTTLQGSGRKAAVKGYRVMTKTGTANILINGQYDTNRNLFTCAGIVEHGDYSRVIVTFIKEAQGYNLYASTVAAPLFERVAQRMLIHEKIL